MYETDMWNKASFLTRLVASSVRISEAAGATIKDVTSECSGVVNSFAVDVLRLEDELSADLKSVKPEDVVVWVDPLDGTAEVALAIKNNNLTLLEQVTVLIGIACRGRPVAGVIHQPYHKGTGRTIWAIQGCGVHGITPAPGIPVYLVSSACELSNGFSAQPQRVVVTTRSHLSQSVTDALNALKEKGLVDVIEKYGGAGYKEYIGSIPKFLKDQLPEIAAKS
ncbi:inositol monophosphatase family protein [Teladorsagia circumcincta]|uniref:3'(2'),5'-bisphosphate nucleotidase n=1 Tax=Teladorsagia circumcincta TaxID=45464 RepID=A0A2G9TXM6_TELCI|nr:inositol monophosphatase family protein [Teladorsagia circumcincta]